MKKNNLLKLLGIAFVVAIVSTGIFYGLFINKLSSSTGSGKMLVVAAKALKPGTVLQATDVKSIPWPADQLPKNAYGTPEQVVGSTVFDSIAEDEPVLATRLASSQSGGGSGVPAGMRAISVHVADSSGVIALLRSGQKVDAQVVVGRGKPGDTTVRTALLGLTVLGVSTALEANGQSQQLPVVTLLAKPAEADVLAIADSGANVRLTLRNPLDEDTKGRSQVSLGAIMRATSNSKSEEKP